MADLPQIQRQVDMLSEHMRQLTEYAADTLRMLRGPQANASAGPNSLTNVPVPSSPLARINEELAALGHAVTCLGDKQREIRTELFGEQIEEADPAMTARAREQFAAQANTKSPYNARSYNPGGVSF
jgi:hypothetical protein